MLFYKHRAYDKGSARERPLPNLLHWLQPVLPRRMPEYDLKLFAEEGYHVSEALIRRDHYALYLSTVSQSSMQRYCINTRIVVVGCSNTAYAFLESLLIRQHNPHYMVRGSLVSLSRCASALCCRSTSTTWCWCALTASTRSCPRRSRSCSRCRRTS